MNTNKLIKEVTLKKILSMHGDKSAVGRAVIGPVTGTDLLSLLI